MFQSFLNWFKQPFDSQGTVWNWALFIGLILVLIVAWSRVINFVSDEV